MHYHNITGIEHFIFQENNNIFHFLVKTITESFRLGVVYLNLVLSTVNRVMLCVIYLQSVAHNDISMIHNLFKIYFIISSYLTDPRSLIPDPCSPVTLQVLLIKIIHFSTTEVFTKVINAFKFRSGKARYGIVILWKWIDMKCCK